MAGLIGLFLRSTDNDYQRHLKDEAEREAKRSGFSIEVESAQNDSARQVAQIKAAIERASASKLVAVLVSSVREDTLGAVARDAAMAGVEWAKLNREAVYIEELRREFTGRAIFSVTPDQVEIGHIHGQQVRALMSEPGLVLCVTGPTAASSTQRRLEGLRQGLGTAYDLIELNADWTSEGARLAVQRWLDAQAADARLPGVFVAHNDEMALGARQALRDAAAARDLPLFTTPILGCDGSQTFGQRLVREGRLKGTVVTPAASGLAIEWVARTRSRGEIPPAVVTQAVSSFPSLSSLRR